MSAAVHMTVGFLFDPANENASLFDSDLMVSGIPDPSVLLPLIWGAVSVLLVWVVSGNIGFAQKRKLFLMFALANAAAVMVAVLTGPFSGKMTVIPGPDGRLTFLESERPGWIAAIATVIVFFLALKWKRVRRKWFEIIRSKAKHHTVRICRNGADWSGTAIADSGNLLREPLSGAPVILLEKDQAVSVWPDCSDWPLTQGPLDELYRIWTGQSAASWRVLPYRTISPEEERLGIAAFRADRIEIAGTLQQQLYWVALTEQRLDPEKKFHAIIPLEGSGGR